MTKQDKQTEIENLLSGWITNPNIIETIMAKVKVLIQSEKEEAISFCKKIVLDTSDGSDYDISDYLMGEFDKFLSSKEKPNV